ncbi:hypothetical protein SAMN05421538_10183 [Paracoccus isoporae]|uniref:UPF0235 protein SAMN05421538_10183 n=1 Tax=Paracoccus isoporae TaxID=591205 RepID=A0A1G6STM6_9RHOB|nr:DUF167 domain-containing protein [Paracoccus isoporae]SDD19974.1 hypothetical protein SAMN05421538_10183 [Paracoccus isoporae]
MAKSLPDLSHLSATGTRFDVRVTPRASDNAIRLDANGAIRVSVTQVPENGKATAAVITLLSRAIGVPKSRLVLIRGANSRDKSFRVAP